MTTGTASPGMASGPAPAIRPPLRQIKGLSASLLARWHSGKPFVSLEDFYVRTRPAGPELDALIRAGAFDGLGQTRTVLFWEARRLSSGAGPAPLFDWAGAPESEHTGPPEREPGSLERLRDEWDLLGFPVSAHPLALFPDVAWETYCPISRLSEFPRQHVTLAGLIVACRSHRQSDGRPMKFLSLCDPTGIAECELFADTYARFGTETIRHPVLEVTATVQPFDNGNGCSLEVHHLRKARENPLTPRL